MNSSSTTQAVFFALGSSFCFAMSSVVFAQFSKQISSAWMNTVKASVCWIALGFVLIFRIWSPVTNTSLLGLFLSGALGLGLGDIFLLGAFARIGASRTLLVFGFQPLIMAIVGASLFAQPLQSIQAFALFFFLVCLGLLSFERYRQEGHWEFVGLAFALVGVLLDTLGIILTRFSFDDSPLLDSLQANFYRTTGALLVFAFFTMIKPFGLLKNFRALKNQDRALVILASLFGTFLSLALYLRALKTGHLATISGIVLTGPLYAAALECLLQKKWPSWYLVVSFVCLICGMGLVLFQSF